MALVREMPASEALAVLVLTLVDPNPAGVVQYNLVTPVVGAVPERRPTREMLLDLGLCGADGNVTIAGAAIAHGAITNAQYGNIVAAEIPEAARARNTSTIVKCLCVLASVARSGNMSNSQISKFFDCAQQDLGGALNRSGTSEMIIDRASKTVMAILNDKDVSIANLVAWLEANRFPLLGSRFRFLSMHGMAPMTICKEIIQMIRDLDPVAVPTGAAAAVAGGPVPTVTASQISNMLPQLPEYTALLNAGRAFIKISPNAAGFRQINIRTLTYFCFDIGTMVFRISNLSGYRGAGQITASDKAKLESIKNLINQAIALRGAVPNQITDAQRTALDGAMTAFEGNRLNLSA